MVEKEQHDRTTCESEHTGAIFRRHGSEAAEPRKLGVYSYRLVHTQESIRVLDLRLDIAELEDIENLSVVFADTVRGILTTAIDEELGLIDQVRYKDS